MTAQIEKCNSVQNKMQQKRNLEEQIERERKKLDDSRLELQRIEVASGLAAAKERKRRRTIFVFGMLMVLLGAGLGTLTFLLYWNKLVFIPAAICLMVGLLLLMRPLLRRSMKESVPFGEEQMLRRQIQDGEDRLISLERDARDLEECTGALESELREFFVSRELSYDRTKAESMLYEMKNRLQEYEGLLQEEKERELSRQKLQEETEQVHQKLKDLMDRMGLQGKSTDPDALKKWISEMLQRLTAYEKECREEEASRNDLAAFKKEHPDLGTEREELISEEEIRQREEEIRGAYNRLSDEETKLHENISAYNRNLEDAYADAESLREKQDRIDALTERQTKEEKRYRLVEKTQEYLKSAKEQFIAKYMQPIKEAFDQYYQLMTGAEGDGSEFRMDANLDVFRKENGEYHDIETQSEGYGDVIGLCIRMALLDVMYGKEKPPVIMDDPFAGLDDAHLKGAKKFLEKVSREYQILYLTCHESRM